jgi:RNA polymerase sigma-70 factor, ECF subfamily
VHRRGAAPSAVSSADLIRLSVEDPPRFGDVFDRHLAVVYRYAVARVGAADAEDITAEAFSVAFRFRDSYDESRGQPVGWLLGITANVIRHHLRTKERGVVRLSRYALLADASRGGFTVADPAEGVVVRRGLLQALATLSPDQQDAVTLVDGVGLTYQEASAALQVPIGTVQSRVARGRLLLRAALLGDPPERSLDAT